MISKFIYYLTINEIARHDEITVSTTLKLFVPLVIPDLGVNSIVGAGKIEGLGAALIVGAAALGYERSGTGTLVVGDLDGRDRCIARELPMVDSETVTLGCGIDEETSLEEGLGRRLDVRDQVGRRKCQLLCPQYHDVS